MNINQSVALNLSAAEPVPRLSMVQGDSNTRTIKATLWDGSQPFSVPAGAACMVRYSKPDGTGGLYDTTEGGAAVTASGSTVTAPVATQMLTVAGLVMAEIDIYGTGSGVSAERLATFRFLVEVTPSVYPDATIISSDYYNILTSAIASAVSAAESAEASAASAAAAVAGAVKYTEAQTLTTAQKMQARNNIGAAAPYVAGSNISISGQTIATKAFPCNPNLLHNWYFPRPVNQRNVSGTISTTGAYFLDRWKLTSGTVTINNDGITLNGTMVQILESAVGAPVVATVLTEAGISEVVPTYSDTTKTFTITAQNKKLLGAKLELGSTQTLAHQNGSAWQFNEIPDYGEELAKCQRFCFVPFPNVSFFARTSFFSANIVQFFIPTPASLRTNPALESGTVNVGAWGSTGLVQGFTYTYTATRNALRILATKTGHGQTDMWMDLNKVIFSADL